MQRSKLLHATFIIACNNLTLSTESVKNYFHSLLFLAVSTIFSY